MIEILQQIPVIYLGLFGSLMAGLSTGLGALPIFFLGKISPRVQGILLGFGAGVMLAATSFSLIMPGIEAAERDGASDVGAAAIVTGGMILGGMFLWVANRYFPHEHFIKGPEGASARALKRIWLFIMASNSQFSRRLSRRGGVWRWVYCQWLSLNHRDRLAKHSRRTGGCPGVTGGKLCQAHCVFDFAVNWLGGTDWRGDQSWDSLPSSTVTPLGNGICGWRNVVCYQRRNHPGISPTGV